MAKGSGSTKSQGANSASAGRTTATQSGLPSNIPASEVEATKGWIKAVEDATTQEKVLSLRNTVEKIFDKGEVSFAAAKAVHDAATAKLLKMKDAADTSAKALKDSLLKMQKNAESNMFKKAGFSKSGDNYNFNHNGAEVTVHKPYTAGNGQKYYTVDITSGDKSFNGSFSQKEVQKLTSMSPQKLSSAVKGYIKDSFDRKKTVTHADIFALQKKYFGI